MEVSARPSYRDKYSIIIPAAGMGRRMKIYGPKSLININKKHTILSKQLMSVNSCFKKYEIILVGGFQHDKLPHYPNMKLLYNPEYEKTNVLHSIQIGLQKTKSNKYLIL